ncbi:MAG: hypothetical protein ABH826_05175 [Patescibacteria group bacterium]
MEEKPRQNPELLQIDKQYKREVALTEAKPFLKRLGLALWFALDIFLIVFFVGYLIYFVFIGLPSSKEEAARVARNIDSTHAISIARAARPLTPGTVRVIEEDSGTYDIYTQLNNPNEDWYATFSYQFVSAAGESTKYKSFILPTESKYLIAFAEPFDTRPLSVDIVLEDINWFRVDAAQISNVSSWTAEHQKFVVENVEHNAALQLDGKAITRTSFSITNRSAFSYWSPQFLVLLGRSGALTAVNTVTIPGFESGETRQVDVNWFGNAPAAASVEIVPNINFFDADEYMTPVSDTSADLRDQF